MHRYSVARASSTHYNTILATRYRSTLAISSCRGSLARCCEDWSRPGEFSTSEEGVALRMRVRSLWMSCIHATLTCSLIAAAVRASGRTSETLLCLFAELYSIED